MNLCPQSPRALRRWGESPLHSSCGSDVSLALVSVTLVWLRLKVNLYDIRTVCRAAGFTNLIQVAAAPLLPDIVGIGMAGNPRGDRVAVLVEELEPGTVMSHAPRPGSQPSDLGVGAVTPQWSIRGLQSSPPQTCWPSACLFRSTRSPAARRCNQPVCLCVYTRTYTSHPHPSWPGQALRPQG